MRRLILFRHAKTEIGSDDLARSLTSRGRAAAPAMGRWLAAQGVEPDLVLCSPSQRTRETWSLASTGTFDPEPAILYDDRVYNATTDGLIVLVRETAPAIGTLVVVGHNPGLSVLVDALIAPLSPRHGYDGGGLPTGAIAVLGFDGHGWREVRAGRGELLAFATPKLIGAPTA